MKQDRKNLRAIRREFSRRQGRTVPARLRKLALSALRSGYTAAEVARAAGISGQSIMNWKNSSDARPRNLTPPVQLKVIGERAVADREPSPTARIRFRSVGNLLTKILESRSPKSGQVVFQGDLSSTNLPSPEIRAKTGLMLAGCGAHARRPFWRYRTDDESLCYFMLRGFLTLSEIETKIDERGRTRENVLKLRGRYGRLVWLALKNRCQLAVTGYIRGMATYPRGITPNIWPKGSELHRAAMYVVNHFDELTLYLKHPELEYTNNASERAVRIEKCMLSSSKFRKTKRGRVTLDILRTVNSTCTAAGVDLTDYLIFVFTQPDLLHEHPESLTPFAFAKSRDPKVIASAANATMGTMPLG